MNWPEDIIGGLIPIAKDGVAHDGYVHLVVSYEPPKLYCGRRVPKRWEKTSREDFEKRDYRTRCMGCEAKLGKERLRQITKDRLGQEGLAL